MRVPKITIRATMLAVAVLACVLAFLATYNRKSGCGTANVPVTFRVVDDRNGLPISGAKLQLIVDYGLPPALSGATRADGELSAVCQAGCTTYVGPFFRRRREFQYSYALRVEAPGYETDEGMLREYMTDPAFHNDRAAYPAVVVRLKSAR